nr:hypothetical protein Itr_chr11CG17410 [Ipomoea trifida]
MPEPSSYPPVAGDTTSATTLAVVVSRRSINMELLTDRAQSAIEPIDALKLATSILGDHNVGSDGVRVTSEEAASGSVYDLRKFFIRGVYCFSFF